MSDGSAELDQMVPGWLTIPEVAKRLGVDVTHVRRLLKERQLAAVRRGPNDAPHVPAAFVAEGTVLKGLAGTLTVLHDAGYSDVEAVRWLFSPDESLPGSPVQALRENRKTEVRRRAQAMAF